MTLTTTEIKPGNRVITLDEVRALSPCYDPEKYGMTEASIVDILGNEAIPAKDCIWLVWRGGFLTDAQKEQFLDLCISLTMAYAIWGWHSSAAAAAYATYAAATYAAATYAAYAADAAADAATYAAAYAAYAAYAADAAAAYAAAAYAAYAAYAADAAAYAADARQEAYSRLIDELIDMLSDG